MIEKLSVRTAVKIGSIARSTWRESGADPSVSKERSHYRKIYDYDEAKICLNCTRKHCNGGEDCFASRKKEMRSASVAKDRGPTDVDPRW